MAELVEPNSGQSNPVQSNPVQPDPVQPDQEQQQQGWAHHHASVTVKKPIHQVYALFTHFNDFPKYMHFIDQVTYIDDMRSHWIADVSGHHEWDAVNQGWVENRQIGWRSYNGLENEGKVTFQPVGEDATRVDVYIDYKPPLGFIGEMAENMGVGGKFEQNLQHDLENFAAMVETTPQQATDPVFSGSLYNGDSAAATGQATAQQDETMGRDYQRDTNDYPTARPVLDQDIINEDNAGSEGTAMHLEE
jgi:uncharacterized membrane protein